VTPDEALTTIDTDMASIMSAKFYNGRRSFGDLIRNLIQSALSLPEVRTRQAAHVTDLVSGHRSPNVRLETRA
jgi:hypothetical protein